MRACNSELDELRRGLTGYLESELESLVSDDNADSNPTAAFQRVIQGAVAHVQSVERDEVAGANVLVAIFVQHESPAARFLQGQGITRYASTRYMGHKVVGEVSPDGAGGKEPGQQTAPRRPGLLAEVRLLNDSYTPMDFVVEVLEQVFGKDHETAIGIMLEIHNGGVGSCGLCPYDVAEAKVAEALHLARQHQHPLHCMLEQRSSV
jgi:ATP-dependent Clp protease adapter protein ClpS